MTITLGREKVRVRPLDTSPQAPAAIYPICAGSSLNGSEVVC